VSARFQAPKGTFDILPADAARRAEVERIAARVLGGAGFGRVETPIFEDTELFERGVGQATDIVRKEMFTFTDLGERSVALRPEGTAPIARAYVEHGMHKLAQPVKLWHAGPYFRYEAPQAGRFRQFNQIGAEAIGSASPLVDAELIGLLDALLRELGVSAELRVSSLGSTEGRGAYRAELQAYLREHEDALSRDVRERIDENPLRAFDSKDEGTREVMRDAPKIVERLEDSDAEHFETVRRLLDEAGIPHSVDPGLVRGLDYYTRTVFSFVSEALGAQSEVGGGGRYDGLIEQLGGPPTPAIGFATGIERILLAADLSEPDTSRDVFVAAADGRREQALALARELRDAGMSAELDLAGRGLKGQMKHADRIGARNAVILDEDGGCVIRDMASGEQRESDPGSVAAALREGAG
jgi:histidyl-tRNA synthetase